MPETRYEIIDGEVEYVPPADQPHGSRHSKVSAVLEAYAAEGYDVASDMLTRTSEKGDMAPDASVYPAAPDPVTGGRQLEELAFEVVSTERLSRTGRKAAALAARGVRRVFAIDVERKRLLAWSRRTGSWEMMASQAFIEDSALVLPLPIEVLVGAAKADDAISRAMIVKDTPAIRAVREQSKAEGRAEGRAEGAAAAKATAVLAILASRKVRTSRRDARVIRETIDERSLDRWFNAALTCASIGELKLHTDKSSAPAAKRSGKPAKKPAKRGRARKAR